MGVNEQQPVIGASGDRSSWAAGVLRRQLMPRDEIVAVLEAEDPEQIRRHLELHAERLHERLVEQLRTLSRLEGLLVDEIEREADRSDVPALSPTGTS